MLLGAEGAGIEGRSGYGDVGIIQRGGSRAVQRGRAFGCKPKLGGAREEGYTHLAVPT